MGTQLNDEPSTAAEFEDDLRDEAIDRPTDNSIPFSVGMTHAV